MLIRRCEWHPRYFRRRKYLGVKCWRPWLRIETTGGMCNDCRREFAKEHAARVRA
ncbi:MAG TPA: hypothetical protein VEA38_00795 [Terriglobales bacterium]|nr:hypothetical protein [Terriglobales bacterium]